MPTDDLPHSTPRAEGIDAAGLTAFLDALDSAQIEMHSLIVMRHGRVVTEGWWSPYEPERRHLLYSLSKSFTSTAAGLAVAEGLLDLDATVLSYFPEFDADITDPRSRSMKVRHVAAMASGHLAETAFQAEQNDPAEPVRGFLMIPPDRDPGTVFAYNQPCTYSLAAIVQRQSGQTLVDYLRPRLFDPLGIGEVSWIEDGAGRNLGYSGLHATTDALARLGQLYLQRGRWGDAQLLDPAWVDQATSRQVDNPAESNPDWRQGYGFQFWMARHGYRGDGAFGQFCIVLPEQDMVVVSTGATLDMQGVLTALWEHVLPAVDGGTPSDEADRRLAERLAVAALPPVAAEAEPSDPAVWDGITFRGEPKPALALPNGVSAGSAVSEVGLARSDGGWRLTLTDSGGTLDLELGRGRWAVAEEQGVPVAVSGGWTGADRFSAEVIFLETPHRVQLTCFGAERRLAVSWPTASIHSGSVLTLRAP